MHFTQPRIATGPARKLNSASLVSFQYAIAGCTMTPDPHARLRRDKTKGRFKKEDMTVCIAAHARVVSRECIVCCFDARIETDVAGSEIGFKLRPLPLGWGALFAGGVPEADDLLARYRRHMREPQPKDANTLDWLRVPAWEYKQLLIDQYLHSTYGISRQEFFSESRGHLGETTADQTLYAIANIKSEAELILFRITDDGSEIYQVSDGFDVSMERDFCSIGSGGLNADSWLHFREQNAMMRRDDTIYALYEAKKFSEISPAVGKKTFIDVIDHHGNITTLGEAQMKTLEKWHKRYGAKPIPDSKLALDLGNCMSSAWGPASKGGPPSPFLYKPEPKPEPQ
jgi:hypothetical protein